MRISVLSPEAPWVLLAFCIGYILITLEHLTRLNKATVALLMSIACWTLLFLSPICPHAENLSCFLGHLAEISQIFFFLVGALIIVETISVYEGFRIVSDHLYLSSKRQFLWLLGFVAFFLSSVLDNLTTTLVMVSLLQKILPKGTDRLIIGAAIVIAANAGGAWTPIGDVTTTMLWIGGQLTTSSIMSSLFFPSLACLLVALFCLQWLLQGTMAPVEKNDAPLSSVGKWIFVLGIALLLCVPLFKVVTGLPPFMGMFLGVGILWVVTDLLHRKDPSKKVLQMPSILKQVDWATALFFVGILLAIDALDRSQLLALLAQWLDTQIGNIVWIATVIGTISAIVDNVPLVAAAMHMYKIAQHPVDSPFWQLVAYCAGTGGSMLVIGSAAGIVYMGLEDVDFFWYLRRISWVAALSYLVGIGVYLLQ